MMHEKYNNMFNLVKYFYLFFISVSEIKMTHTIDYDPMLINIIVELLFVTLLCCLFHIIIFCFI